MTHARNTAVGTAVASQRAHARRERIIELHRQGMPDADIADKVHCCVRTVQRHLLESGTRRPGAAAPVSRMTEAEIAQARAMLEDGQSYHAVAKVLGRYMKTIERNVPGFPKLTMAERAERAVLGRQLRRVERRLRL